MNKPFLIILILILIGGSFYYINIKSFSDNKIVPKREMSEEEKERVMEVIAKEEETRYEVSPVILTAYSLRSNIDRYYHEVEKGSYKNYKDYWEWDEVLNLYPTDCNIERLKEDFSDYLDETDNIRHYQLEIEEGEAPQRYVGWGPLCKSEKIYCVDYLGNLMEIEKKDLEKSIKNFRCINDYLD